MTRNRTTIFTAPQGWGKTRQAAQLMRQYQCTAVVEDWFPQPSRKLYKKSVTPARLTPNALHLTNVHPDVIRELLPGIVGGDQATVVAHGWRDQT